MIIKSIISSKFLKSFLKNYKNSLKNKTILITGSSGFIGQNLQKYLRNNSIKYISPKSSEYDLRNENHVSKLFSDYQFDTIIHLAGVAGGINYIKENKTDIYYSNLMINTLLLKYSLANNISSIVALNTVNAYPSGISPPFSEEFLFSGLPEKNISSYGMAKRMMIFQSELYADTKSIKIINLLSDNIYGPHDIFNRDKARVIPANILRCLEAKENNTDIFVWGSGKALRDFVFVDDIIGAIIFSIEEIKESTYFNVGTGNSISLKKLLNKIASQTNYDGGINWDNSKPEGELIRLLDVKKMNQLGYHAKTSIDDGLKKTIEWYRNNIP